MARSPLVRPLQRGRDPPYDARSHTPSSYLQVYDFSDFLDEHPAGPEAILEHGGKDGTEVFAKIHNMGMLDDFEPIGMLEKL